MARSKAGSPILKVLTAAGLGTSAYVHIHLAPKYDNVVATSGITQGMLFRGIGAIAIVMALVVLATNSKAMHFVAFVVAAGTLAAVLLYRYSNVGAVGPFPNMHEPTWYTQKTLSMIGEALATTTALILVLRRRTTRNPSRTRKTQPQDHPIR